MSIPKVNLRVVRRKSGDVYQLDYAVNGRRIREVVGTKKRNAELIQAKIQTLQLSLHETGKRKQVNVVR